MSTALDRLGPLLALLVVVAGTLQSVPFLRDAAVRPSDGFIAYYTAARLIASGRAAAVLYDDEAFRAATRSLAVGADDIYYVNPPTTALVLLPLAGLDYAAARAIWTAASFFLLLAVGAFVLRQLELRGWRLVALAALPFFFRPLAANFEHGQLYVLVGALLAIAWFAFRTRRDALLGVAMALLLLTKLAALPLWLVLAVQWRFRPLFVAIGATAAIFLVTMPVLGMSGWPGFFDLLMSLGSEEGLASPAYQSVPGLIRQLTPDPASGADRLVDAPGFGPALTLLVPGLLLIVTLAVAARRGSSDLVFAATIALSLAVSPLTSEYHYTLMLLPIAILLRSTSRRDLLLLAVAAWLIAADLAPRHSVPGYATLGGYARLAGALLVCAIALRKAWRTAPDVPPG